ncbi:hypothetical protein F5X96DRAFT_329630 [Biscogniauxia mediterranea]|nr:hypothetical protein F5X96DRAFT_329630 [Biscogniauxia mediterranea]
MPLNPRRSSYFMPMYGMRGSPMFIHPYAFVCDESETRICHAQQKVTAAGASIQRHATPPAVPQSNTAHAVMMADMKISLAAKQLAEQVKESKKFWVAFRENFEKEVTNIKPYVDGHILRQIWQKRIENDDESSRSKRQHDVRLCIQNVKLENCLNQIDEAINFLNMARSSHGQSAGHNPRYHHLEKIRAAGGLVVGLSKKSMTDEAACKDLLTELLDLERLLDPKSPVARSLHRSITDGAQEAAEMEDKKPDEKDSSKSEGDVQNEPVTIDQDESNSASDLEHEQAHECSDWAM